MAIKKFLFTPIVVFTLWCLLCPVLASWEDENSVWFGEQRLNCLRRRRSISRPTWTMATHKLVAFRGQVYEWGYLGGVRIRAPYASDCTELWDSIPAGISGCTPNDATEFAESYRERYGDFDMLTNNSHHFANRLVQFLLSVCISK